MTIFNPDNKETLTLGEALGPAMEITEQEDADQYKKAYIEYMKKHLESNPNPMGFVAEYIVDMNLGYYAGYYSSETQQRVQKLFNVTHPIFGSATS
jgi:hypothetical protein